MRFAETKAGGVRSADWLIRAAADADDVMKLASKAVARIAREIRDPLKNVSPNSLSFDLIDLDFP